MARTPQATVVETARNAVPFLVITGLWLVVMLVVYGLFLATKPDVTYDPWVHASVFVVPGVGFVGHVLQQALRGG